MQCMADTQVEAFTVDTGHLRWRTLRQPGLLDIVGDGRCMIIVHVLNHAPLHLAILDSEGIGQGDVVQPVNCTETTYVAPAHRLQHPEVEVMYAVVVLRLGK